MLSFPLLFHSNLLIYFVGLGGADEDDELDGRLHNRRSANPTYMDDNRNIGGHTHRFPKERHKTWVSLVSEKRNSKIYFIETQLILRHFQLALCLLFVAGCMNDLVLSFIHDFVPETPPLPDIVFAHTPYLPWALRISEYLMLSSFAVLMALAISHKHRWIIFRQKQIFWILI